MKKPLGPHKYTKEFNNSEPIPFKEFKEAHERENKIKIY